MSENPNAKKPSAWLTLLTLSGFLILLAWLVVHVAVPLIFYGGPWITIVNRTGTKITGAKFTWHDPEETYSKSVRFEEFEPDEQRTFRIGETDPRITLTYSQEGQQYRHEECMDLWTSETFSFELRANGEVKSGHVTNTEGRNVGSNESD